ncbi:MAG: carbon-nitrogen hydrolase family protein [Nitrososphaerota archaeon]|nr:carbon-nitrogen hydrolase family protein [Nitrososphaerota archaeon]MDG6980604.1 carbon-nitrogen hydrolase family protein [Nitrososphaerota archaeon]
MNSGSLRVAAVQMECSGSLGEIEDRALKMIRKAARLGADIACLPEHWSPEVIENPAEFLSLFEEAARDSKIHLISGGDFIREGGSTYVESFFIGPNGLLGTQRKVHLFGREKRKAKPGSEYPIFRAAGSKVGIAICHDIVYPEVARILALKGAEVIFSPARIGGSGLYPWRLYILARALENRIPIVSPNFLSRSQGGSVIVGIEDVGDGIVYPKVLARAGSHPRLLVADLDLKSARKLRARRLKARRVETFSRIAEP